MTRVMVDIEAFGQGPGCVVATIGAVRFEHERVEGAPGDQFYGRIDLESCQEVGLTFDAGTVVWWLQQDEHARQQVTGATEHLRSVLEQFSAFIKKHKQPEVWANAPTYDLMILRAAYAACGLKTPWHYRDERCMRTILARARHEGFAGHGVRPNEHKHDALADAAFQARLLLSAEDYLGRR